MSVMSETMASQPAELGRMLVDASDVTAAAERPGGSLQTQAPASILFPRPPLIAVLPSLRSTGSRFSIQQRPD
jgi:hypothetical protein